MPSDPKPYSNGILKRALHPKEVLNLATTSNPNYDQLSVGYDVAASQRWYRNGNYVKKGSIGTGGICGSTIFVMWSSKATLLIHMAERRGTLLHWWTDENKEKQNAADKAFLDEIQAMIEHGATLEDFPVGDRSIFIITPQFRRNLDHPRVDTNQPADYYYPRQVLGLKLGFENLGFPLTIIPYHPIDPAEVRSEGTEARDTVLVNVEKVEGKLTLRLYLGGLLTGYTQVLAPA